ncbi:iron-containing alcohol dehydrogenase [Caproiciproducens sp.]
MQDSRLTMADPTDLATLRVALRESDPDYTLHPIQMDSIFIQRQALEILPQVVSKLTNGTGKNILMVTDSTPYFRESSSVKEKVYFLLTQHFQVEWLVMHNETKDLHADNVNSKIIGNALQGKDCVIGVGGGTITDLCKDSTHMFGDDLPLVIVQTALSVNAFSDGVAVMLKNGVKRTVEARYPTVLIIDLDVVQQAPPERNLAGYGDLMATWTAPVDWYLSHVIGMNANYHESPSIILRPQLRELMKKSDRLAKMDRGTLSLLARVLTLSGLSMGIAGESSPASGTEHIISHLIDMSADSRGKNVAFHGAQVAVGAIMTSIAWDFFLKEFDPSKVDIDRCFPGHEEMKPKVYAAFSWLDKDQHAASECWSDYEKKLTKWHSAQESFRSFLNNWDSFKEEAEKKTLSPEYLCECMHTAGAPTRYSRLTPEIDAKTVRWAMNNCHLFRNRFTLSDLLYFLGWWDEAFVERILDRAETLDAGL